MKVDHKLLKDAFAAVCSLACGAFRAADRAYAAGLSEYEERRFKEDLRGAGHCYSSAATAHPVRR